MWRLVPTECTKYPPEWPYLHNSTPKDQLHLMSEPSSELMLDRGSIEIARRSAFAVATHSPEDFNGMRRAGRLAAEVLDLLVPEVKPGVTTEALDKLAFDYVQAHGALPACLGYRGYRHTLCTSIN